MRRPKTKKKEEHKKPKREKKARNGTAQFIHSWIAIECLKAASPNMKRKSQRTKTSRDDTLQQNGNGKSANLPEMETFLEEQCDRGGSHHLFPNK
jgi:hypothetical protein